MGFLRENKILIGITCLVVVLSIVPIGNRMAVEERNKNYDVVLDYDEMDMLAEQSDKELPYWLVHFREKLNIHKVAIMEESINSLTENPEKAVSGRMMAEITKEADWRKNYEFELLQMLDSRGFDRYDVLVEIADPEMAEFLLNAVKNRFEKDKYEIVSVVGKSYILLDGNSKNALYSQAYKLSKSNKGGFIEKMDVINSKIMYISLGLLPEKVELVKKAGCQIVPRTLSYHGFNGEKFAKAVIDEYEKYGIKPQYMIAGGEGVIGFDDGIDTAKQYLEENKIKIGLIENNDQLKNILQEGIEEIAIESNFDAVRVFSVWNYIQYRFAYYGYHDSKEIENTLFRAITERNIRLIYFKPIKENQDLFTYITDIAEYDKMFTNLEKRLGEHGFKLGDATVMENLQVSKMYKLGISFGCVSGALLLLGMLFDMRKKTKGILLGIGIAGACAASYVIPNSFELLVSFAAAVIFACLAVSVYVYGSSLLQEKVDKELCIGRTVLYSIGIVILSVGVALMGGMMTASPLSATNYMLEIDIFRGVKLAQLLPIVYYPVIFVVCFGFGNMGKSRAAGEGNISRISGIRAMLNTDVKIWMLMAAAVIGAMGAYYMMRTGHSSSAEVSNIEIMFRNYLEDHLIARPRNKEFLFAFPAVMLMVYGSIRRLPALWTGMLGLFGVLGMTSVNNTFMHLRTPLYLGFARTGYSLLFGIVIGGVLILIFEVIGKFYQKWILPRLGSV